MWLRAPVNGRYRRAASCTITATCCHSRPLHRWPAAVMGRCSHKTAAGARLQRSSRPRFSCGRSSMRSRRSVPRVPTSRSRSGRASRAWSTVSPSTRARQCGRGICWWNWRTARSRRDWRWRKRRCRKAAASTSATSRSPRRRRSRRRTSISCWRRCAPTRRRLKQPGHGLRTPGSGRPSPVVSACGMSVPAALSTPRPSSRRWMTSAGSSSTSRCRRHS